MYTWSTDDIRALALQSEGARSYLSFVLSKEVAEAIAAKARQYLITKKVSSTRANGLVKVGPSIWHAGTWMVSISLPGVAIRATIGRERTREQMQAQATQRREQLLLGLNALRASYSSADLVTTWTGKHPPMAP